MVDPVVILTAGHGSAIALKASGGGSLTRVDDAFSEVLNAWLADHGASNLGAPSGLAELAKPEVIGAPGELAESLIRAAGRAGLELAPCEVDDTVFVVALVYCRPTGPSLE